MQANHLAFPASSEGRTLQVFGASVELLVTAGESSGAVTIARLLVPAGWVNTPHIHWFEDECFYLLAGELELSVGTQTFPLFPGHSAFGPRRVAHAIRNLSDAPASLLVMVTPGGIERFFAAAHAAFPPDVPADPGAVADLIERHGMSAL